MRNYEKRKLYTLDRINETVLEYTYSAWDAEPARHLHYNSLWELTAKAQDYWIRKGLKLMRLP